jgi:putative ABC transport system permease protein
MLITLRWSAPLLLGLATAAAAPVAEPAPGSPPAILLSRQLIAAEHLKLGEIVMLSSDPAGGNARPFRVVGSYEPVPDPARLGEARLEARLHLPDLLQLRGNTREPATSESVAAINVRLVEPGDAPAFARELSARLPGVVVRPTLQDDRSVDVMAILDRFHMAIALVTLVASSLFLLALMVMLVDERRGMVAVLRLIGLRRVRILQHVVVEGLVIACAGAAFGVALAALLEGVFNRFFEWRFDTSLVFVHVTPRIAWRSALLAVPLGVLATVLSSWSLLRGDAATLTRR